MLTKELTAQLESERARAIAEYATLLGRADKPRKGDVDKLRTVLATLGRTPQDVDRDLERLRAYTAHTSAVAERDAATATLHVAMQTLRAAEAAYVERERTLHAERDAALKPLLGAVNAARGALTTMNLTLQQTSSDADQWQAFLENVTIDDLRARRRRTPAPSEPAPGDETTTYVRPGEGVSQAGATIVDGVPHGETISGRDATEVTYDQPARVANPNRKARQQAQREAFENLTDSEKEEVKRLVTPRSS